MPLTEQAQTTRSAAFISLAAAAGAIVGFVLQLLVAYYFGASAETDAYFMALSTSELLSKLLLGGSVVAVFLPLLVERLQRDRREAEQLALNVFHLAATVFIVATVLLGLFAPKFVHFIAPGFSPNTAALTVSLLRWLLPAFVFLFLVDLATAALHALRAFTVPAALRIVQPLVSILAIIVFIKALDIYALALGVVAGAAVQLALVLWRLYRLGLRYRWRFAPRDAAIRRLLLLVYPFILSVLVTQGAGITYRILVSGLAPGSLAALKFAEKITQLLTIMFVNSVTIVMYPTLAAKAAAHNFIGLRDSIAFAIRLIIFATVPVTIGTVLLREPLIRVIYQRGSFQPEDVGPTATALLYLALGLAVNGISSVLGHATLALKATRAAVAVTVASQAIAIASFVLLVPHMQLSGLALASSLVPLAIALLYWLYLTRFIPRLTAIFWQSSYLRVAILAIALALTVNATHKLAIYSTSPLILQLAFPSLAGAVVFFGGAALMRLPEMRELTAALRAQLHRVRL